MDFKGELGNYQIVRGWNRYDDVFENESLHINKGDERITEEDGRLIIDIRGFETDTLTIHNMGGTIDDMGITRIYFDGSIEP